MNVVMIFGDCIATGVADVMLAGRASLVYVYHRLRGRRQFPMGKNGNFDPCKIETLEQIDTQFVRFYYVQERNVFFQIW